MINKKTLLSKELFIIISTLKQQIQHFIFLKIMIVYSIQKSHAFLKMKLQSDDWYNLLIVLKNFPVHSYQPI